MDNSSPTHESNAREFSLAADPTTPATVARALKPDHALVRRAQAGDRGAFDVLAKRYRHRVMNVCRRYMHDSADAEDAVQMTLIRAYRGLRRFRGESEFYSWLHRIAINSAVTLVSLQKRRESWLVGDLQEDEVSAFPMAGTADTPEGMVVADEIRNAVWRAIASLGNEQRRTLVLHDLEGMSYSEVASAMSCAVGTVRSRLFRAREAVDKRIRPMHVGGLGRVKRRRSAASGPNRIR